jgi:D-aminoacyl-tRNA deacylase
MIAVIQRVSSASVEIESMIKASIFKGLLVLVGIEDEDSEEDISWLASKVVNLRIFNDDDGVMNKSVLDESGDIIIVSQFTLHASTKKGNRPSYLKASKPDKAIPVYERFIRETENLMGRKVQTGEFGADMKVALVNDGPVTIIIDTRNRV